MGEMRNFKVSAPAPSSGVPLGIRLALLVLLPVLNLSLWLIIATIAATGFLALALVAPTSSRSSLHVPRRATDTVIS